MCKNNELRQGGGRDDIRHVTIVKIPYIIDDSDMSNIIPASSSFNSTFSELGGT